MAFETVAEPLPGLRVLDPGGFRDGRGAFTKLFHLPSLGAALGGAALREVFVTESAQGVVRGMHFQSPPHDHLKLVACTRGRVLDVVLDLRRGSPAYGRAMGIELDGAAPRLVWIPPGFAHGFAARTDGAQMLYMTTAEHAPDHDHGIAWDSFGFDWPEGAGRGPGLLSERDGRHPALASFESPFSWDG